MNSASLKNLVCCAISFKCYKFLYVWLPNIFLVQIARRLLGKILIDLHNTREEAISVAELKGSQEPTSMFAKTRKEETEYQVRSLNKNEDPRRSSTTSEKSLDQDDEDDRETKYRLDPKFLS